MSEAKDISPVELNRIHDNDSAITVIDVRTPAEFREVHIPFAKNIPLDRLDADSIPATYGDIYIVCKSGSRSRNACSKALFDSDLAPIVLEGGTDAWIAAGLDVTRGKKTISLERQVRIAAGSLVVLGVILGLTIHPGFTGLSAFVGAGLVFAGLTDTCGMGMLLARMPWNQVPTNHTT